MPEIPDMFGNTQTRNEDNESSMNAKVGHCIEPFSDVRGAETIEELFKSAKINFYGSGGNDMIENGGSGTKEEERREMDPLQVTTSLCVPLPLKLEAESPQKEVFLPANANVASNNDRFNPAVEITYVYCEEDEANDGPTGTKKDEANEGPKGSKKEHPNYYCHICKVDTKSYSKIISHYRMVHKVSVYVKPKPKSISMPCDVCGKTFASRSNFYTHAKTHKVCNRKYLTFYFILSSRRHQFHLQQIK